MKKILLSLVDAAEGNVWNLDVKNVKKVVSATCLPAFFIPDPHKYSNNISIISLYFGDWRYIRSNAVLMGSKRNFMSKFLSQLDNNIEATKLNGRINHYCNLRDCNTDHILYTDNDICQSYQVDKQVQLAIDACIDNNWESLIIPEQLIGYEPTPLCNSVYECVDLIVKSAKDYINDKNKSTNFPLRRIVFCTTSNSTWRLYNTLIPWHFTKD